MNSDNAGEFSYDVLDDNRIALSIECRIGDLPALLQSILDGTILPLAQQRDPERLAEYQALLESQKSEPVTQPPNDDWLDNEPNDFSSGARG